MGWSRAGEKWEGKVVLERNEVESTEILVLLFVLY